MNPSDKVVKKLFNAIEITVPHALIIMDGLEHEDCHFDPDGNLYPPPQPLFDLCREFYGAERSNGKEHPVAVDIVCSIEPFNSNIAYRAMLDAIVEGGDGRAADN